MQVLNLGYVPSQTKWKIREVEVMLMESQQQLGFTVTQVKVFQF